MRDAIDDLITTIDLYSDAITKKYGSGDADGKEEEVVGGQPKNSPRCPRSPARLTTSSGR